MPFKHNKKRNAALVYEFLVRQMGHRLLEGDQPGYRDTLRIVRRYFSANTILGAERELFEAVKTTRGVPEIVARRVLGIIRDRFMRLDHRKVDIKKSNLIKEINHGYGREFFTRYRVPEYRMLASIQMFL